MLRRHWAGAVVPVWQARTPIAEGLQAGLDDAGALAAKCGPVDLVLSLAGTTPGRGDLSLNAALGLAAVRVAHACGARHVFLPSSAAVYGRCDTPFQESDPPAPRSAYGREKLAMETSARRAASAEGLRVTVLRIGNVAGADALLGQDGFARKLDRFADGQGPRRSYIGPRSLTQTLAALCDLAAQDMPLPEVLNIAQPGPVAMADLCQAAGLAVTWRPAPPDALPHVALDTNALTALVPVSPASAAGLIREWHADKARAR